MDFLSLFFYRLPQDYIPKKGRKKCRHVFLVKKVGAVLHTMYVNTIVCIVFCTPKYILSTSKTSIYSVSRRLTDFSVLDEAYFLPNSFYVDFPIEINVPHTQTIKVAVISDGFAMIFLEMFFGFLNLFMEIEKCRISC